MMARILFLICTLHLTTAVFAPIIRAQAFSGTGQQATEMFPLSEGLAVFELEHRGSSRFVVRLLNERGALTEEVVSATGPFNGSKAIEVPRTGQYLLDVTADGAWSVRLRSGATTTSSPSQSHSMNASPQFVQGRQEGESVAASVSTAGWLARGLLGGAVAGPLGAAIAVGLAGKSDAPLATTQRAGLAHRDPGYTQGFEEGFAAQLRQQRRKKAFIGGMIGSGVFIAALIYALDVAGSGGTAGGKILPPGTEQSLQPLHP